MIESEAIMEGLDTDWIKLILEAKKLGLGKEEIRDFLKKKAELNAY